MTTEQKGMIRLNGIITIPLAEQERFKPLLDQHIALTRGEPGCIKFDVTNDEAAPDAFRVSELFTNAAAFDHHQTRTKASEWGLQSGHLKRDFHKEEL